MIDGEGVVDLVGDAGSERPDRRHPIGDRESLLHRDLLGLDRSQPLSRRLCSAPLGHVPEYGEVASGHDVGDGAELDDQDSAVGMQDLELACLLAHVKERRPGLVDLLGDEGLGTRGRASVGAPRS